MTRPRDPFLQALGSLRLRIEQGAYPPGRPIVIKREAQRLRYSTTPLREALSWLGGEGLVERAPQGGFVAPRLDGATVVDRYRFRLHCLQAALSTPLLAGAALEVSAPGREVLQRQLTRLVRGGGGVALLDAFKRVSAQLLPLGAAESRLFPDVEREAVELLELIAQARREPLLEGLSRYHHRRIEAAPRLVVEAETAWSNGGKG